MKAPLLVVVAALLSLCLPSVLAQPSQSVCNITTTGLPTAASGLGLWNLTSWPTTNQFTSDPDAGITVAQVTYTSMFGFQFPPGSFVIWGGNGQVLGSSTTEVNQTFPTYWRSLSLSAGGGYQSGVGNAQCAHRGTFLRLYVIGDSYTGTFQPNASYVFATSNEYNFSSVLSSTTQAAWTAGSRQLAYSGCVVDIQDRVYSLGDSDIWQSLDQGVTWSNITTSSLYTPRQAFAYDIFTGTSGDVMFVLGGVSLSGTALNDVWASQSSGSSWQRRSVAPWSPRVGPNVAISPSGVLALHGGAATFPVAGATTFYSDAYISLDLGATWTLLTANTGITRALAPTVFDAQGYLYVYSGYTVGGASSVGWRSNYALNNIQQWGTGTTSGALTFPSNFSPCVAYTNISAVVQPPTARSSSAVSAAASSAGSSSAATSVPAASAVSSAAATSVPAASAVSSAAATSPAAAAATSAVAVTSPAVRVSSSAAATSAPVVINPTSTPAATPTSTPTPAAATSAPTTPTQTSAPVVTPFITSVPASVSSAVNTRGVTGLVLGAALAAVSALLLL